MPDPERAEVAVLTCLAAFLTLLTLAAVEDVRARRIPNWLTGGLVALYPIFVLASPDPIAWPAALALAGAVFFVGWLLFARHMVGGGDVKLITAVSLWAGVQHALAFAIVTSLAGGVLALGVLLFERWRALITAPLAGLGVGGAGRVPVAAAGELPDAPPAPANPARTTLPYGVAIAAGGVFVAAQLMKF